HHQPHTPTDKICVLASSPKGFVALTGILIIWLHGIQHSFHITPSIHKQTHTQNLHNKYTHTLKHTRTHTNTHTHTPHTPHTHTHTLSNKTDIQGKRRTGSSLRCSANTT